MPLSTELDHDQILTSITGICSIALNLKLDSLIITWFETSDGLLAQKPRKPPGAEGLITSEI